MANQPSDNQTPPTSDPNVLAPDKKDSSQVSPLVSSAVAHPDAHQTESSKDNKANSPQANTDLCPTCGNSPGHKFSCPKLERNCVMPLGMRKGTKSGTEEKKEG